MLDVELAKMDPELARKVGNRLHDAVDRFEGVLADAETELRRTRNQAALNVNTATSDAQNKLMARAERVDNFLNEKPAQAAGIAFAAGVLTALWLKRG